MNNPSKNRCMDCLAHANPMLRDAVKAALRWAPPVLLALTASQAWAETLSVYGTDGKSGKSYALKFELRLPQAWNGRSNRLNTRLDQFGHGGGRRRR